MATKIRLKRLGKIRSPHYRIVVMDSRSKRDGQAIEEIGLYHPKNDPSLIRVNSERAQYWLSVGAQPTEAVVAIFKRSGDWQKFTGEDIPSGILPQPEPRDREAEFAKALAEDGNAVAPAISKAKKKAEEEAAKEASEAPVADALEHLVAGIVSNPDDVTVRDKNLRRGRLLEVRVHPEDIGKVIGRQGRTASALRTVLGALAGNEQVRVDFVDVDRPRRR